MGFIVNFGNSSSVRKHIKERDYIRDKEIRNQKIVKSNESFDKSNIKSNK